MQPCRTSSLYPRRYPFPESRSFIGDLLSAGAAALWVAVMILFYLLSIPNANVVMTVLIRRHDDASCVLLPALPLLIAPALAACDFPAAGGWLSNDVYDFTGCAGPEMFIGVHLQNTRVTVESPTSTATFKLVASFTFTNCIFTINSAPNHAGLYVYAGVVIRNCTFNYNGVGNTLYSGFEGQSFNSQYIFTNINAMSTPTYTQTSTDDSYTYNIGTRNFVPLPFASKASLFVRTRITVINTNGAQSREFTLNTLLADARVVVQDSTLDTFTMKGEVGPNTTFTIRGSSLKRIMIGDSSTAPDSTKGCLVDKVCSILLEDLVVSGSTSGSPALQIYGKYAAFTYFSVNRCNLSGASSYGILTAATTEFRGGATLNITSSTIEAVYFQHRTNSAGTANPHVLEMRGNIINPTVTNLQGAVVFARATTANGLYGTYVLLYRNTISSMGTTAGIAVADTGVFGHVETYVSVIENSIQAPSNQFSLAAIGLLEVVGNNFTAGINFAFGPSPGPALLMDNTIAGAIANTGSTPSTSAVTIACNRGITAFPTNAGPLKVPICTNYSTAQRCTIAYPMFQPDKPRTVRITRRSPHALCTTPMASEVAAIKPKTETVTLTVPVPKTETHSSTVTLIEATSTHVETDNPPRTPTRELTLSKTPLATLSRSIPPSPSISLTISPSPSLSRIGSASASITVTAEQTTTESPNASTSVTGMASSSQSRPYTLSVSVSTSIGSPTATLVPAPTQSNSASPPLSSTASVRRAQQGYVPSPAADAANDIAGTIGAVGGVLGSTSGQLTTVMALIRLVQCGDGYDASDEDADADLPILVHPLRFAIPLGSSFDTQDAQQRDSLMAQYRGAVLGNCFLVPLISAAVLYWPLSAAVGWFAGHGLDLPKGRELVAWPSIVITPFVVMAEGIATSCVMLAADGGAANMIFAVVGAVVAIALVAVWARLLWLLPLRRLQLTRVPYYGVFSFWLVARREWALRQEPSRQCRRRIIDGFHEEAGDLVEHNGTLATPLQGGKDCGDAEVEMVGTAPPSDAAGSAPPDEQNDANASGPTPQDLTPEEEAALEQRMATIASLMSEKWLIWADLASLVLSLGVGIMEGIEPSSPAVCLPRAVCAIVLAVLQCAFGLMTLIPLDMALNVAQGVLTLVVCCVLIAVVLAEDDAGMGPLLDDMSVAIAVLGIAGVMIGFVQVRSRAKGIARRKGRSTAAHKRYDSRGGAEEGTPDTAALPVSLPSLSTTGESSEEEEASYKRGKGAVTSRNFEASRNGYDPLAPPAPLPDSDDDYLGVGRPIYPTATAAPLSYAPSSNWHLQVLAEADVTAKAEEDRRWLQQRPSITSSVSFALSPQVSAAMSTFAHQPGSLVANAQPRQPHNNNHDNGEDEFNDNTVPADIFSLIDALEMDV